tara:strand:+ start:218 stop:604 length:387 start_codon:yes stop_codon:yes gene_type:complete
MSSKSDPILVFRDEIMARIIKNKLIDLACENKGTFETINDFYDQFRERYEVSVSNVAIRNWLKELDIRLQSSFQFIDQATLDLMAKKKQLPSGEVPFDGKAEGAVEYLRRHNGIVPEEEDLDALFDNE